MATSESISIIYGVDTDTVDIKYTWNQLGQEMVENLIRCLLLLRKTLTV